MARSMKYPPIKGLKQNLGGGDNGPFDFRVSVLGFISGTRFQMPIYIWVTLQTIPKINISAHQNKNERDL